MLQPASAHRPTAEGDKGVLYPSSLLARRYTSPNLIRQPSERRMNRYCLLLLEACLEALELGAGQVEAVQVAAAGEGRALQRLAAQLRLPQAPVARHRQRPAVMRSRSA